ncbi:MAG: nucleoside-diphosphate sugar epimerase, partial [Saprospiraceae bacterium]
MIATGFDLSAFIREKVTGRAQPLTAADMTRHGETLRQRIEHKSALVLGGAGTIGSHFIKTLLKFNP